MKVSTKSKMKLLLSRLKLINFAKRTLSLIRLIKRHLILLKDEFIWHKINKKINLSEDEWGFICNAHNGDTYVFCSYMEIFKQKYGGKITVIVKESQISIPKMFPAIDRIISFKKLPSYLFGSLTLNSIPSKGKLVFGYPYGYVRIIAYDKLNNFYSPFEMLFEMQLNLDNAATRSLPIIELDTKYKALKKLNFISEAKKSIIISPYSYSLQNLEESFWIDLSNKLNELGYLVITNISKSEKPIPNTVGLNVDFDEIIPIVEKIGIVIGMRSGFFDIISSSSCVKIILYPKLFYGLSNRSAIDIFHLSSDKKFEFEVDFSHLDDSIDKILQILSYIENS